MMNQMMIIMNKMMIFTHETTMLITSIMYLAVLIQNQTTYLQMKTRQQHLQKSKRLQGKKSGSVRKKLHTIISFQNLNTTLQPPKYKHGTGNPGPPSKENVKQKQLSAYMNSSQARNLLKFSGKMSTLLNTTYLQQKMTEKADILAAQMITYWTLLSSPWNGIMKSSALNHPTMMNIIAPSLSTL